MDRDTTEVEQLVGLSRLDGRSAVLDAAFGLLCSDALDEAIDASPDEPEGIWATAFRRKIYDQFNEIAPLAAVRGGAGQTS
jgi:hypothetical protein